MDRDQQRRIALASRSRLQANYSEMTGDRDDTPHERLPIGFGTRNGRSFTDMERDRQLQMAYYRRLQAEASEMTGDRDDTPHHRRLQAEAREMSDDGDERD
eukprot:TRINITY_DN52587_c0_g1_i3.p2 TRINITY_DN52587_c0_g1~~TRINITY_DN52587_c0_g1_i3.p2  ORF type:complete len:101 (-),score=12.93 TRINITY_DN52587_c0_g1_i3:384-686(-)